MPSLIEIVDNQARVSEVAAVLRTLKLQPKLILDLEKLYFAKTGVPVSRDKGNRVRGETVWSCSRVGKVLSNHFGPTGYVDTMMWVGYLAEKRGQEYWIMRPNVRKAVESIEWFGNTHPIQLRAGAAAHDAESGN